MAEPYQVPDDLIERGHRAGLDYDKAAAEFDWRGYVGAVLAAVLPAHEAAVRADERAKVAAPQEEYVDISYGPWEASGHRCDDLIPGGCDEPVASRQVFVHTPRGKQLFGPELGHCPNRCAPRGRGEADA